MNALIPSAEEVRAALSKLSYSQVGALAAKSGVPFTTLWKVRNGVTANPGVETVRKFFSLLPQS